MTLASSVFSVAPSSPERLRRLPTTARPIVNADDILVPEGYRVEAVLVGLSLPTTLTFAPDGTLFIAEGGSTWPTRPTLPPRLLTLSPEGELEVFATEDLAGVRGMSVRDGMLYASAKGGYFSRLVRYDLATRERTLILETMPNGGWHEPAGPIFGPDGLMYFGQGSVSIQGIVGAADFTVDVAKHPRAHDVPGQDVILTGANDWSRDPTAPYPFLTETGPFKPYGTRAEKGEVVGGELWCNSAVWRAKPDGSEVELLAWGIRNPWGLTFDEEGDLYVADLCMEEKDPRPVGQDPSKVWRVKNARKPHGTVETPEWFGFPEIAGDGLPVWHEKHWPRRGPVPQPLIENPPPWAGPAVYLNDPHTGNGKIEYCGYDGFGRRGKLFLCQFGTYWPLNSLREEHQNNGFNVVAIDPGTGEAENFMRNRVPGPASAHPGQGGLERPVDCAFSPDGRSMYVLDFGVNAANKRNVVAYAHTGVLWRVTRL